MTAIDTKFAQVIVEKSILTFVVDPPDTDFQLGFLSALAETLVELGGVDYSEFVMLCRRNVKSKQ